MRVVPVVNSRTKSALISFLDPFDPRFRILETTVQMLDKQSVNNNFYSIFHRNCTEASMCN